MKYTIMGFNQAKAVELNLDTDDLLILSYFSDFRDTELMVSEEFEGKRYYWLRYDALLENLPILRIASKSSLRRRLKKLQDAKVLSHYCKKTKEGTYSFYGIGENFLILKATMQKCTVGTTQKETMQKSLLNPVDNSTIQKCTVPTNHKCTTGTAQINDGVLHKCTTGTAQINDQNINLLKDSSIKNISLLENKEQSSSSDSTLEIREEIAKILLPYSNYENCNAVYDTWFKNSNISEINGNIKISVSNQILKIFPRKYIGILEKALNKKIELLESE